jgi:hypothetical protein
MEGIARRITSIKGFSERTRLPRLGKIFLGKKVKKNTPNPGCSCSPQEACLKCTYPTETTYFVVPPEVAKIYGEKPTELRVKVPVNDVEVVFPQAYKYYGASRGLKCYGDGEIAYRMNEKTFAMEQTVCPCHLADKECRKTGILNVILYEVSQVGVYQITTRSSNSMRDVRSGLLYAGALLGGNFAMVPLILKRVKTPIQNLSTGKMKDHYILQLLIDAASPEFGKKLPTAKDQYALPPADEISPELDGPLATEEEIQADSSLNSPTEPPDGEISSIVTPVRQIFVRTEKDPQGRSIRKYRIATEAGVYFTREESLKNIALMALKNTEFVEIEFVSDPREGNLIKSIKRSTDEKAQ